MAEAEPMAGPKSPTDPPKRTVNGAEIKGRSIFRLSIIPSRLDNESKIDGMACSLGL